jgi:hypothetical protein
MTDDERRTDGDESERSETIPTGRAGLAVLGLGARETTATDGGADRPDAAVEGTGTTAPDYHVRGEAPDAMGTGLLGRNASGSGAGEGVVGVTNAPGIDDPFSLTFDTAAGVRGEATGSAGVRTAGVFGRDGSASDGAAGVKGTATNGDGGTTYGVYGETLGGPGAAGVYGRTTTEARNYGVLGETGGTDGHGVLGRATAGDPEGANGVRGETAGGNGAGVQGVNTSLSGSAYGVVGEASPPDVSAGVFGLSSDGDAPRGGGVYGINSSTGVDSAGVRGVNFATSGATHGVYGETGDAGSAVYGRSTGDGFGVFSDGDAAVSGDSFVYGDLVAVGSVAANEVTTSRVGAHASHTARTEVGADGDATQVELGAVEFDDFGWHTTYPVYGFEISEAGAYHVDAKLTWFDLGGSQLYSVAVDKGTESLASGGNEGDKTTTLSRTFRHDGNSTETVHMDVRLYGTHDRKIALQTYLSLVKLG